MPRLRPRADSPAGKSFRGLRDRLLAGVGSPPSPNQAALAERAAWAGVHLAAIDRKLVAGQVLTAEESALPESLSRVLGTALRTLRDLGVHGTDARPVAPAGMSGAAA